MAKSCVQCQAAKNAPPAAPLQLCAWPSRVLEGIHMNFAGPFKGAMLLVAIDVYSK